MYSYARNNPIDFTDPIGLIIAIKDPFDYSFFWRRLFGRGGGSSGYDDEPEGFGFASSGNAPSKPQQDKKKCTVKNVGDMSEELQNMLRGFGIENADFDKLGNDAKLGFLNILGAMEAAGLSLTGWIVDRKRGRLRIDQERTFFTPKNPKSNVYDNLKEAVGRSKFNRQNHWKHKDVDTSFRQNPSKNSLQIGFGKKKVSKQPFMEIDIDPFNPHKLPLEHFFADVLRNKIAGVFGGAGKTDPYRAANRKYWECKKQKGGGKK